MPNRWLIQLCLLVSVVLTGLWLMRINEGGPAGKAVLRHEPDSFMERFSQTEMDTNGQIKSRLYAERMLHYADDGSTELFQPRFEFYDVGAATPWYASANRAEVKENSTLVMLYGGVHLWQEDPYGRRAVELLTEQLQVHPQVHTAQTDSEATIYTLTSRHQGLGLRVNLDKKKLKLLAKVKSHYDVKKPKS
jgi:lipopolysaccharide export system protein LptC